MFGDYNNIIVNIFDSISKIFSDLSCKASEVFGGYDNGRNSRLRKALYMILGAFFLVIYGITGVVCAIIQIFMPAGNRQSMSREKLKIRELSCVLTMCIAVFIAFFLLCKTDYAKNRNLVYFSSRNSINETCKNHLPRVNSFDADMTSYLYHLRNSLECRNTSDEVMAVRSMVDDDLPDGIHFATLNDYLVMLLSLEEFDVLDRFVSLYDKERNTTIFQKYLNEFCKMSFNFSRFHTSDTCLDLILKYARYESIGGTPHYNNSFYLMRSFNEDIMDRYYSSHHNNDLLSVIINDVWCIEDVFEHDKFAAPLSRHESEIMEYLGLVNAFYKEYNADDFLAFNKKTGSEVLKQYALNMALRDQFRYTSSLINAYDSDRKAIDEALRALEKIKQRSKHEITYPYLASDYDLYEISYFN